MTIPKCLSNAYHKWVKAEGLDYSDYCKTKTYCEICGEYSPKTLEEHGEDIVSEEEKPKRPVKCDVKGSYHSWIPVDDVTFKTFCEVCGLYSERTLSEHNKAAQKEAELPDTGYEKPRKHDKGKPRFDLIPPLPLEEVAAVFGFGANKYDDNNYLKGNGLEIKRLVRAALGHINKYQQGETIDKESGEQSLAHAICSLFMIRQIELKRGKK